MCSKNTLLNQLTFYKTQPLPCPYLPNKFETKILTYLPVQGEYIYSDLLHLGFRRSQDVAYKPLCDNCNACQSIRVVVDSFEPNKTQKRILKRNDNLIRKIAPPYLTNSHFDLYQKYIHERHHGEEMSNMTFQDLQMMVEKTNIDTIIVEYYMVNETTNIKELCGWVLTDLTLHGPSMVYSVFDPNYNKNSLGVYAVLNHINFAIDLGYPYLFLGYWIKNSKKMTYKTQFQPYELYINGQWL